jgi:hypothetical protein
MSRYKNKPRSRATRMTQRSHDGYDTAMSSIANHPATAILVTFGVGCAIGLLLGHSLAEPPRDTRSRLTVFGHDLLEGMRHHMPKAFA